MKRFLLSRLSALGDVVCTLPAAVALKQSFPDCHITWAVDPRFAGVVECCQAVDEVLRIKPAISPGSWPTVDGEFDVAFDMQGLFKSGIVVARSEASRKLGFHWQREGARLFSSPVLPDDTSLHVVDQYVDVVRAAGAECGRAAFHLAPNAADVDSVKQKLGDVSGALVIVNPGAGWVSKRWPPAHFAALIERLSVDGCVCALIGGKADVDKAAAQEVLSVCSARPINLVGETSVRELIALISLCSAHVGGDTGSSHIAAALERPAIGLYSITKPHRSCPYGQIDRCLYHPDSLASIQPDEVYRAVREALA